MKFRSILTSALLILSLTASAFETGQTVRLVNNGMSLFVENSSLDENKNVVLWTETNVNAQRWTLNAKTNGTFLLSNDYTGFYLAGLTSGSSGNVGQTNKTGANSKGSWEFVPVEGSDNQYYIYQGTTRRYALAAAANPTEGSKLTIINTASATSIDPARIKWTVEVVEPMEQAFTKDKRDDMMEAFKKRHYKKQSSGYSIDNGGWWGDAEMFETVLDALETTGDQQYATMFDNLYTNFISRNGSDWTRTGQGWPRYNEYNDDIAWICIACTRGYMLTGQTKYRSTAKTNFDKMYKRANCYGNDLLQWKAGDQNTKEGTNACINGPATVCACYLAIATADTSYYDKAIKTYAAHRNLLYEKSGGTFTGKVFDSGNAVNMTVGNTWASTYNEGTSLGAAVLLYKYTGDEMYRKDADAINTWSKKNLANSRGIVNACQTVGGDLCGFKGILLRYMRLYAEELEHPENYDWMAKNAYHAWNNRNSAGITSSAWLTKAEENFKHQEGDNLKNFEAFGNSTCLSAAFNCHLGAVDSHDAYAKNEAEDFNFVRNAPVAYDNCADEEGGGMAGPMRNNHYIGYRRVNFGDKPASHIDLRLNITIGTTGIDVFLDQPDAKKGTLLCNIKGNELSALKSWSTIRKMISQPVTGTHDIYFVSSGSGQTNINWWQFQSLNPVFADLTNGSGTLSTSFATNEASMLTDDDLTTVCNADIEVGTETWIQYKSPSPMRLHGYQFFSGSNTSGNPKGWSLQASNDGKNWETLHEEPDTTFTVSAERYSADIQTTKSYTHYRMLFKCHDTQTKLSVSEWQLMGRCIDDYDLTADGGSTTEGYEALTDHVGTTIFTTPTTLVYRPTGNYKLTAYSITAEAASEAPTSWKLEGSANGSTWKPIDEQTEAIFPYDKCTNVYLVAPETSYLYYRLTIADEAAQLTQWQLFGKPDYGTFYADITRIASITASDGSNAWSLFDKDGSTYASLNGENPYWDMTTSLPVKVIGFSFLSADDAELDPNSIALYGYNDEGEETLLSSKTLDFPARGSRLTYTTTSTKLFKRFRLQANDETTTKIRLSEFELYGTAVAETDDPNLLVPAGVEATETGLSKTELIERICDGNRTSCYRSNFTEPVSITYTYSQPVSINAYSITASKSEPTRDPADWTLEGSNDGNTWTELDSQSGQSFSNRYATQFWSVLNGEEGSERFTTYRLTVTATSGADQLQIGEIQLLSLKLTDPTGIELVPSLSKEAGTGNVYYNLSGQRLNKPQKGINIINGKKIVVKF